jgi:hypothetical protein
LEAGHEPIRYPLRGSIRSAIRVNLNPALNTEILTPPAGHNLRMILRRLRFFFALAFASFV